MALEAQLPFFIYLKLQVCSDIPFCAIGIDKAFRYNYDSSIEMNVI